MILPRNHQGQLNGNKKVKKLCYHELSELGLVTVVKKILKFT
jgi:hypothetical protein